MNNANRKGFTLVELLAVITIIGIVMVFAIPNVSNLINKSKKDSRESNEKTLLMAGKSYMQANNGELPKVIGSQKTIKADDLKKSGYLKEDLTDGNKKICMKDSFVTVIKSDSNKYLYSAKLLCPGDSSETITENKPDIEIHFYHDNEEINPINPNNTKLANRVKVDFIGEAGYELAGYNYSILVSYGSDDYTQIKSDFKKVDNKLTEETPDINLADYIDVTKNYILKVSAGAYNIQGDYNTGSRTHGSSPNGPICGNYKIFDYNAQTGKYYKTPSYDSTKDKNGPSWIKEGPRKVVIDCVDKTGIGCKKEQYTKIFLTSGTGDDEVRDNGKGKIIIEANREGENFTTQCFVPVNFDRTKPEVPTIDMYKWITNSKTPNYSSIPKDSSGNSIVYEDGEWSEKYVYTEPHSTDTGSGIDYYMYTTRGATTDETNAKGRYRNIKAEGKSQIKWKACDKVGNCSDYSEFANVNIFTGGNPDNLKRPTFEFYKWDGTGDPAAEIKANHLEKYTLNTWTNTNVVVYFQHEDRDKFDVSFRYQKYNAGGASVGSGIVPDDVLVITDEGITKWQFWATYAGKYDTYRNYDYVTVKIDRTPPTFKVTFRKDSQDLASTTATEYEYPGEINDNFTLLLSNVSDNNGSGVNRNYEFSYNAPHLTTFSTDIAKTEVRTLTNNSNSRDITSYGKRVFWINLTDNVGNEVQTRLKVNIRNTKIDGNRFICDSNKLKIYHITSCPNDSLCYFDKLNGLTNNSDVNRPNLKSEIPSECLKTKCVKSSSGANCRNGASTSGTSVNRTLAYGTTLTAAETSTSGWSYSSNYGCYISSNLLADNCSSSGGGTADDDIPSSGSCHQYRRCAAAGCASTTQQCTKVGGFKYKGNYDSNGACEPRYSPSRCGRGTSCTNCQYDSCTYTCTSYRRAAVCGCEY